MGPPPVNNRTERTKGGNLPQLVPNLVEPNGPQRFSDVVTGDECWISFFTMKDKRSNMVWLVEDEPRPEVLKTGFRSRKRMFTIFFSTQGPVVVDIARQNYSHCHILQNFSFAERSFA